MCNVHMYVCIHVYVCTSGCTLLYIRSYIYVCVMVAIQTRLICCMHLPSRGHTYCMHESKGVQCPKVSANIPVSGNP